MDKVQRIDTLCQRHGVSIAAAALQFVLHHPCVASVIPGASSAAEVQRNLATFKTSVPDDLWAELKAAGLLRNDAPTP
jgi:D-threo-aldose 1-dehydrogenase